MATLLDQLVISFGLDTKELEGGIKQADSAIDSFKTKALAAFAAIGVGLGAKAIIMNFAESADAAGKLSDALGVSMSDLQAWGAVAGKEGGSVEAFNSSLKGLNTQLNVIATGGGSRISDTLKTLGISAVDVAGKVKSPIAVMEELSAKFQGLSAAQVLGLGTKMGLDEGTIALLRKGKNAIDEMIKKEKELGEYTQKDAEIAAKFNDQLEDTRKALTMAFAPIVATILPAFTAMAEGIQWVAQQVRNGLKWMEDLYERHPIVIKTALAVAAAAMLKVMLPVIISMTVATLKWAAATLAATWPIIAIGAAVIALSLAIGALVEDVMSWLDGGDSALGDFYQQIADIGKLIAAFFVGLWNGIVEGAKSAFNWIAEKFQWLSNKFQAVKSFFVGGEVNVKNGATLKPSAADAVPQTMALGKTGGNKNVTATQSIGTVNINTQATDASGIAKDIGQATQNSWENMVSAADSGVRQ